MLGFVVHEAAKGMRNTHVDVQHQRCLTENCDPARLILVLHISNHFKINDMRPQDDLYHRCSKTIQQSSQASGEHLSSQSVVTSGHGLVLNIHDVASACPKQRRGPVYLALADNRSSRRIQIMIAGEAVRHIEMPCLDLTQAPTTHWENR